MSSTFGIYSIASSGMYVNQASLSVTSNNLSNVNTSGYSRQQVVGEENTIKQSGNTIGSGTTIQEISRARNQFIDQTYRQQNTKLGYWDAKSANLEDASVILNEFTADDGTSGNGLLITIEEFFYGWEELAKDPSSLSNRQSVIEYANALVETLSEIDYQLQQLQLDAAAKVKDGVEQLNNLAQQVADYNTKIMKAEAGGAKANELRDQRDSLIDSMSALANISVNEQADGMLTITIGGIYLVQGNKTNSLQASGDGSIQNPLKVQWLELGQNAQIDSGSIRAYWDDADQSGIDSITSDEIPFSYSTSSSSSISNLRQGLNDLITTLALEINEVHSSGFGLDGSTGLDFFVAADTTKPLSISNIKVNPALEKDTNKIAASTSGETGDNTAANAISSVASEECFKFSGLTMDSTSFYQALISWLGTEGSTANSNYETQSMLVTQADNQRQSLSAVSLDEEMSKMIMYQNAYSASARVLNTIDSLVEDMIEELS